jgi:hypothetical protein
MPRIILSVFAMLFCGISLAGERDWEKLHEVIDKAKSCNENAIALLIGESVRMGLGADEGQTLSLGNDLVFLGCPILFLRTLNTRSESEQERLVSLRFGVFHDEWVLGAVLRRLVDHPEVGTLVRRRFGLYLEAEVPDVPKKADCS